MKNLFHFFVVVMIGLSLPLSLSAQTIDELKTRAANGDAMAQYNFLPKGDDLLDARKRLLRSPYSKPSVNPRHKNAIQAIRKA